MDNNSPDVLIVGAGVAGLTCARDLQQLGRSVVVLDKGRSVGGRCSTWRTDDGHLFDYGVNFFHGSNPHFLAELDAVDGGIEGWPEKVLGHGDPCQPRALRANEKRVAFVNGTSSFAKHLATGLDVRVNTRVVSIEKSVNGFLVGLEGGNVVALNLILALPGEQSRALIAPLADGEDETAGVCRILDMLKGVSCLSLCATYDHAPPDWHLLLPDASRILQLVANESSKRPHAKGCGLVLQARAGWSAIHLGDAPESWTDALLQEAATHLGDWVLTPTWSRPHRWRYARTDLASELAGPIVLRFGVSQLGLAGELFSRGAGVEAAYLSGRALARRFSPGHNNEQQL